VTRFKHKAAVTVQKTRAIARKDAGTILADEKAALK
jgi:hypothetical protein